MKETELAFSKYIPAKISKEKSLKYAQLRSESFTPKHISGLLAIPVEGREITTDFGNALGGEAVGKDRRERYLQ